MVAQVKTKTIFIITDIDEVIELLQSITDSDDPEKTVNDFIEKSKLVDCSTCRYKEGCDLKSEEPTECIWWREI